MAQSHAIIEQYSESESSIEDNPVLDPESEIVIPLRTPQDQGKIKEKFYEQGDHISARLRGIPGNLGGFFSEIILNHHLELVRLVSPESPVKLVRVVKLRALVGRSQQRFLHHQRFFHLFLILYL